MAQPSGAPLRRYDVCKDDAINELLEIFSLIPDLSPGGSSWHRDHARTELVRKLQARKHRLGPDEERGMYTLIRILDPSLVVSGMPPEEGA